MTDPVESLSIVNVVATTSIPQELDLPALAADLEDAELGPDTLPAIVYRTEEPATSTLVFRTGNMAITGAESIDAIEAAAAEIFDTFRSLGLAVSDEPVISVENMVVTGDLGQSLNLPAIAIGFGLETIEYEPEEFPGLVYRPRGLDTVTLLFSSGKIVIAGGTELEDAERAMEQVHNRLADDHLIG